ncbi:MAG: hypothetical protein HRT38_17990 [Alteromonadaceae bacterium]|nr:hypothetical protein [Alteromonadaceae bacterium]
MTDYILSIDQGTTSSRAILFNTQGKSEFSAHEEFQQYFPEDGWVEHDPEDIWQTVKRTCTEVMTQLDHEHDRINTIGITNQRETTLIWDRKTGKPVYKAIVWQDRRTSKYCEKMALFHNTVVPR